MLRLITIKEWFNRLLRAVKKATGIGEPSGSTTVYLRERRVLEIIKKIFPDEPYELGGRFSWLVSPYSDHELQIDIFLPNILSINGITLSTSRRLAIEVQSSLHDGKWDSGKRRFFRTKEQFDAYTKNQLWKKKQLKLLHIPLLEIDPDKDDMTIKDINRRVCELLNILM